MRATFLIAVSIALFSLMPLSIAFPIVQKQERQPTDIGSTVIWGVITRPRYINAGHEVCFRAIYVHYRTHWLGTYQKGVLHALQLVTVQNDFNGFLRHHLVWARFDGTINVSM